MITRPKSLSLPSRIDSSVLAKHRVGDEPMVVVKVTGIGATAPYELHDAGTRIIVLRWDIALGGHILRVPLSLWMDSKAKFAHDLMDQHGLRYPIVVLFDTNSPAVSSEVDEKGAPVALERRPRRPRPPQGGDWPEGGPSEPGHVRRGPDAQEGIPLDPVGIGVTEEPEIIRAIKVLLATGKKRVGDLAIELPADEDVVREAIESEGSGLRVAGGWVQLLEG